MGVVSIGVVPMGVVSLGVVGMGVVNACVVGMGVLVAGLHAMGIWTVSPNRTGTMALRTVVRCRPWPTAIRSRPGREPLPWDAPACTAWGPCGCRAPPTPSGAASG